MSAERRKGVVRNAGGAALIVAVLLAASAAAVADDDRTKNELSGSIAIELRGFADDPAFAGQDGEAAHL